MTHDELERAFIEHVRYHHGSVIHATEQPQPVADDEALEEEISEDERAKMIAAVHRAADRMAIAENQEIATLRAKLAKAEQTELIGSRALSDLGQQVEALTRELETAKDGRAAHLKSHNEAVAERDRLKADLAKAIQFRDDQAESAVKANERARERLMEIDRLKADLAAAPDMLAALKESLSLYEERERAFGVESTTLRIIRTAIAKATP